MLTVNLTASPFRLPIRRQLEPAFVLDQVAQLAVPDFLDEVTTAEYFAYAVAREPRNLKHHVQRVLWHLHAGDAEATFAALIDLYLALGTAGMPLKQRLLQQAVPILNERQHAVLSEALLTGLHAHDARVAVLGSVLAQPVLGQLDYLQKQQDSSSAQQLSVLEEARLLLEDGHVGAAQQMLEQAWQEQPGDVQVQAELAVIYRATGNQVALRELAARSV